MEKSRLTLLLICITACSFMIHTFAQRSKGERQRAKTENKQIVKNSYNRVPTLQLASAIAESILKENYGDTTIENQKPFAVALKDDVWIIDGKADGEGNNSHIEICKSTGSILSISK